MARYSFFSTYILRNVPVRTGVIVIAMIIFFKIVFTCPCTTPEETLLHCWLYMCLPICILCFILILIDYRLLKICRCYVCRCCAGGQRRCCECECCDAFECCCCAAGYCYHPESCGQEGCYYCTMIWKHLLNVFYAGSLWVVVAFIDGDWYVCIRTAVNGTGLQIACKDLPTPEEAKILRKYDSESRVIGLILILALLFMLTINSSLMIRWKPYYKSLFEVYLEQETSAILEDRLHEKAVERAKYVSEHSLRNIQNQFMNAAQDDDTHHVQYQQLGNPAEDLWHHISNPALHLTGYTNELL